MSGPYLPPASAVIGADHAGRGLKDRLKAWLTNQGFHVTDLGAHDDQSADYPVYAAAAAQALADGRAAFGALICGSGQGMSISANRFPGVRAALCHSPELADLARRHNDANILTLGSRFITEESALDVLQAFVSAPFEGGRHARRVSLIESARERADLPAAAPLQLRSTVGSPPMNDAAHSSPAPFAGGFFTKPLREDDPAVYAAVRHELARQQNTIELIASENIVSFSALEAQGTVLTNKYAEGYPGKRYYGGCEHVDEIESLAIERACKLFECGYANVQPNSGSQANQAVMLALLQPGDTVLGLSLACGGHLTHGAEVNLSGKWFNAVQYGVSADNALIDFAEVERLAKEHKPKLIIAGCSAYPRVLDWKRFSEIAESVGAFFMVDMAHMAGLVAGGSYPSPLPYADVVTSTTHKTLRGPRGGLILSARPDKPVRKTASGKDVTLAQALNSAVFPGLQGGPLMHVIAAKAVAFGQALRPEFKAYAKQIRDNAEILAKTLAERGVAIVSGGTDSHVVLADLRPKKMTGKAAEEALERAGLTCNKNAIPFDPEKPFVTSGIRLGTPAGTTRGFGTEEFKRIGNWIVDVLEAQTQGETQAKETEVRIRAQVETLCKAFPVYPGL